MGLFCMLKSIFLVKHLDNPRNRRTFALANKKHRGVEQLVARQAHNLEVARSSRTPATKKKPQRLLFLYLRILASTNHESVNACCCDKMSRNLPLYWLFWQFALYKMIGLRIIFIRIMFDMKI